MFLVFELNINLQLLRNIFVIKDIHIFGEKNLAEHSTFMVCEIRLQKNIGYQIN